MHNYTLASDIEHLQAHAPRTLVATATDYTVPIHLHVLPNNLNRGKLFSTYIILVICHTLQIYLAIAMTCLHS